MVLMFLVVACTGAALSVPVIRIGRAWGVL